MAVLAGFTWAAQQSDPATFSLPPVLFRSEEVSPAPKGIHPTSKFPLSVPLTQMLMACLKWAVPRQEQGMNQCHTASVLDLLGQATLHLFPLELIHFVSTS